MAEGDFVNTFQPPNALAPVVIGQCGKQIEVGEIVGGVRVKPSGNAYYTAGQSPEERYVPATVPVFI